MFQQIQLIGHLGADPEVKAVTVKSGERSVANLRVAVNERWSDDEGTKQEHTEWFAVEAWGALADAAKHLAKGRLVHVVGRLRTDEWQDESGKPRSRVKVMAQRIDFLDAPPAKPATDAPRS